MGKEVVPNPELRKIGLEFYKGPFKFDHMGGYIWAKGDKSTQGNQMFADLDQASERCARIRGWGALQYLKGVDCEALQDEIGVMFAEAITEYWDRAKNAQVFEIKDPAIDQGESAKTLIEWVAVNGGWGADCRIISRLKPGLKMAITPDNCDYFVKLVLPSHGINATLKEGDTVTLQHGRVLVDVKPRVIYPGDIPAGTNDASLLPFNPTEQQN
jgi:hypothetical protein